MKVVNKIAILGTFAFLTACTSFHNPLASDTPAPANQPAPLGAGTKPGGTIGGSVAGSMDSFDRSKLSKALDKAPGTVTTWVNANTGTDYMVTPVKKVTVNGNDFCREYQVVAVRSGNRQESTGTACVAADGSWSGI